MRCCFKLASYYRRYIETFGKNAAPLTKMFETNRPFVSDDDAKFAFSELPMLLANVPILIYLDFSVSFLLAFNV